MTGRYKITLNSLRTWEPEKRTARRWSLFVNTCRLLARDGLDYRVTFALDGDDPHVLINAWRQPSRKRKRTATSRPAPPALKPEACALRAQEAAWFLPKNRDRRNSDAEHWRRRRARYAELSGMAEDELHAEREFWRELELLSGQRQHFKPGLTHESVWADEEVAA